MAHISLEILQRVSTKTKEETLAEFVVPLQIACDRYEINTISRLSCFLAQCAHESVEFAVIKENMNYSAKVLRKLYSKQFTTDELAAEYANDTEKIANLVYANRMGNGDEESGDGFKYIGRGLFPLTGYNNYKAFSDELGMPIDEVIDYLETAEGAAISAAWFWKTSNLNDYADHEDMLNLTKRLVGGTIGLDKRIDKFDILKGAFQTQI